MSGTALSLSVDQKLDTVNDNFNQKIHQINQKLDNINRLFKEQGKFQRIEFAIENCEYGSFEYHVFKECNAYGTSIYSNESVSSSTLVKAILFSFRKGYGHFLPEAVIGCRYNVLFNKDEEKNEEADNEKFRDRLVEQIFCLTGTKPKITEDDDGDYSIWYS